MENRIINLLLFDYKAKCIDDGIDVANHQPDVI